MFKGIIKNIGVVSDIVNVEKCSKRVLVSPIKYDFLDNVVIGDSISCSGICLTVVDIFNKYKEKQDFAVDISRETLSVTNANTWVQGTELNLEKSLLVGDSIDGHFVQGHIDSTVKILYIVPIDDCYKMVFSIPKQLSKYIARKGSITLNGVSLTVNDINDQDFTVNIIPYTWQSTTFYKSKVGDYVNLEVDIISRYLERLVNCKRDFA